MGTIYRNGVAYGGFVYSINESSLPRLFVTAAAMPTTKDNVDCKFLYEDSDIVLEVYGKIKCQGTSSMSYPKKNYTIELFTNSERNTKLDYEFKRGWGEHSKYCLKANWVDHSHMRNIISGCIWKDIVESRSDYNSLPTEIKGAYNHGAVDGYPFKLYANGHYEGIYTWNIPKADWMFNMDKTNLDHVALCAEVNSHGQTVETACNFKKLWTGVDGVDWSIEVGSNSAALVASVNDAIGFVIDSTDSEFIEGIDTYFDINNIIDYYIFAYFINALDNLGKNMIMITYDGVKWYLSPYDLDSTYGNFYDGTHIVAYNYKCPQDYEEQYSRLFARVWDLFPLQIKARYEELRSSVLTMENIIVKAEDFSESIGSDLYKRDVDIYPAIPNPNGNNVWQIEDYMYARQAYVDSEFSNLRARVACTGVSVDSTMTLTTIDPVQLQVVLTPANSTDRVFYSSSNSVIATVSDFGVIQPLANGTTVITVRCDDITTTCTLTVRLTSEYSTRVEALIDNGGWSEMAGGTTSVLHTVGAAIYFPNLTNIGELDVFMFDVNGNSLGYKWVTSYNGEVIIPDPDTYSVNIHFYDPNGYHPTMTIMSGGIDLTAQANTWTAGVLDTTTGEITADPTSHAWFSDPILISALNTVATTCVGDATNSSYNYKGCVMYNGETYVGVTGSSDIYRDDYNQDVTSVLTSVRLAATDMDSDTKSPSGKVRIFNFDKNA